MSIMPRLSSPPAQGVRKASYSGYRSVWWLRCNALLLAAQAACSWGPASDDSCTELIRNAFCLAIRPNLPKCKSCSDVLVRSVPDWLLSRQPDGGLRLGIPVPTYASLPALAGKHVQTRATVNESCDHVTVADDRMPHHHCLLVSCIRNARLLHCLGQTCCAAQCMRLSIYSRASAPSR